MYCKQILLDSTCDLIMYCTVRTTYVIKRTYLKLLLNTQVSTMKLFEHYEMSIPMFSPSLDFLTFLHMKHIFVRERVQTGNSPLKGSKLSYAKDYMGSARILEFNNGSTNRYKALDPNNDFDECAVRHWLSFSDYYSLPHNVLFESIDHLVKILQEMWQDRSRLQAIHIDMRLANRSRLKSLLRYWRKRLMDIAKASPHKPE